MYKNFEINNRNGFFLHAASVLCREGAILLLGHSGSGKSTLSGMLSKHFEVLRDDCVYLLYSNQKWFVEINHNIKAGHVEGEVVADSRLSGDRTRYPLAAIVRVFGAQHSKVNILTSIKVCEYLIDAVFEITHQRLTKDIIIEKQWFNFAANIARNYPGWQLQFTLEPYDVLLQFEKMSISGTFGSDQNTEEE